MKIISLSNILFALICLVFSGCQTTEINTEIDPDANLSAYKTYSILPVPDKIAGIDPGIVLRVRDLVRDSVKSELDAKGYTEVQVGVADIAINLTGQIVPKVDITNMGYMDVNHHGWIHGYPYYSPEMSVDQYDEGSLIIEVYNRSTKKMVWVGWGKTRRSERGPDPERIKETVNLILETYPAVSK